MIQTQSADGILHQFPDGTDPGIVDKAMKDYARSTPKAPSVTVDQMRKFAKPPPQNAFQQVSGLAANFNRGTGLGDELAGFVDSRINMGKDILSGKIKIDPKDVNGSMDRASSNAFSASMAKQRQTEDGYDAQHPNMAALLRGTGMAATAAIPAGDTANAFATGSRALNAVRGATMAGLNSAAYAASDRGTLKERTQATADAANPIKNPLTFAMGAGAGSLATAPKPSASANAFSDTVDRFEKAGVDPMLAAAGNKGTATATNVVAENPIAGIGVRGRLRNAMNQADASASDIASQYGETRGRQITGENVQKGLNAFAGSKAATPTNIATPATQSSFGSKADALYERAFTPIQTAEAQAVDKSTTEYQSKLSGVKQAQAAEDVSRQKSWEAANAQQNRDWAKAVAQDSQRVEELKARGFDAKPADIPQPKPLPKPIPAQMSEISPQRPAVTPTKTLSVLQDMSGRVNAPKLSSMITDGRINSIMGALESDSHNVRFNDLRELRTWVRNAQRDPQLRQGIPQAGLQRIEQALTGDIYDNAERLAGPKALHNLQRADDFYRAGMGRIQGALQSFADAGSGEGAYNRIVQAAGSTASADAQKLLSLKRSLPPDHWGDVSSNVISEMGNQTPGNAPAGQSGFSVNTFVTNYNKLSERGKDILFGATGGGGAKATALRSALDNLASVADNLKQIEKGANTSKSFVNAQALTTATGLIVPHTTIPTAGMLAGGALTGEVLTNPAVIRRLAASARTGGLDAAQKALRAEIGARAARTAGLIAPRTTSGVPAVEVSVPPRPDPGVGRSYARP